MTSTAVIKIKSDSDHKSAIGGKFLFGLLILAFAFAAFFCWQHFNLFHHHAQTPARTGRTVPVAATAAAAKPVSPAKPSAPTGSSKTKTDSHPVAAKAADASATQKNEPVANSKPVEKSEQPVAAKSFVAGFVSYVANAFAPSAKAATVEQEMPPAPQPAAAATMPAKRVALPAVAAPLPAPKPQVLTPEQKRLQVAQDGFDHVIDSATRNPGAYGFASEESLGDASLGKEIPIYTIAPPGNGTAANQPVSSLLKPADEWVYPIVSENHIYYMIKVKYDGHDYVLGEGSRALGQTYDKILAKWPADKGFHPQLIVVSGIPGYYFSIPELPEQNITDTDRMFDYEPEVSPASIVLANVQ
jgi:hypothetical protein